MTRCGWLALLGCLGCRAVLPYPDLGEAAAPVAAEAADSDRLMDLAAASYEGGDDAETARHLQAYVSQRPDHLIARAQLGELLFRQNQLSDARLQFELFIAQAQEHGDRAFKYVIHSHSRLVDIAETQQDEYQEHLHRGIGLYLLGCRRAEEPDPDGDLSVTALLCRAAVQLQEARAEQPAEARPHLYLYHIWSRLGQQTAARRALAAAETHAPIAILTPLERRQMQVALLAETTPTPIANATSRSSRP